jgi:uncharacterized protein YggE
MKTTIELDDTQAREVKNALKDRVEKYEACIKLNDVGSRDQSAKESYIDRIRSLEEVTRQIKG